MFKSNSLKDRNFELVSAWISYLPVLWIILVYRVVQKKVYGVI